MTYAKTLHDVKSPDDLPFCGPDCLGCAIDALGRDLAFFGDVDGHEGSVSLGSVFYRPGTARAEELRQALLEEEARYPDPAYEAEMAYERHLENRYSFDDGALRDLEYHNQLWPTYYGCPTDPGASL